MSRDPSAGCQPTDRTKPSDLLTIMSLATHRPILNSHANEEVLGTVLASLEEIRVSYQRGHYVNPLLLERVLA